VPAAENGPVSKTSIDSILANLDLVFEKAKIEKIVEGRRIEFFEGKRKGKDGQTRKTGHYYWQWRWKTDTGRRAKYGGRIETASRRIKPCR